MFPKNFITFFFSIQKFYSFFLVFIMQYIKFVNQNFQIFKNKKKLTIKPIYVHENHLFWLMPSLYLETNSTKLRQNNQNP